MKPWDVCTPNVPKCAQPLSRESFIQKYLFLSLSLSASNQWTSWLSIQHTRKKKGTNKLCLGYTNIWSASMQKVIIKSAPDWWIPMFFLNKCFLMSPNSAMHRFFQVYTALQPWLVPQRVGLPSLRGTVTCSRLSESMKTWFVRGLCKACWIEMNAPGRKAPFSIRH